jgi:MFS family permease
MVCRMLPLSHRLNRGGKPRRRRTLAGVTTPVQPKPRLGPSYWRLWWANAVDNAGDGAFASALPLLAVTLTRNPELISAVSVATYLPWLVVSLPAGVLVDRRDRVRLMWQAQVVQGAAVTAVAVLVAVHHVSIWTLVCAGLCLGGAQVVFDNAAQSVLPSLVQKDLLPKANGTLYVVQVIGGSFLGPPVGSALFAVAPVVPFAVDAASFAGSAALLTGLPRPQRRQKKQQPTEEGFARGVTAGVRWLSRHRLLRIVAVMLAVSGFAGQMGTATFVLFATQTLHVSVRGYGLLLASSAAGSVIGGLVNPVLARRVGPVPLLVMVSCITSARAVAMGLAPNAIILGALMACGGFSTTLWNVVTVSMRQREVPAELFGRVNSVYRMVGWGTRPLGALAGGMVAEAAGLRAPFIVGGILRGAIFLALLPALLSAAGPPGGTIHDLPAGGSQMPGGKA